MSAVVLLLLFPAAFEFSPPGGIGNSMIAGVAVPFAENVATHNPGLAGALEQNSVEIATARLFDIADIYSHVVVAGWRKPGLSGRFSLLGSNGYQEFTGSIAKGFPITEHLSFGALLSLYLLSITDEFSEAVPGLSAGILYHGRVFGAGAAVHNFNRPGFVNGDVIPSRVTVGASILPQTNLRLAADAEYDNSLQFRFGAAFTLHPALTLSLGMGTNPLRYAGGLRCNLSRLGLNYTYLFHPKLKQSHIIGLGYSF